MSLAPDALLAWLRPTPLPPEVELRFDAEVRAASITTTRVRLALAVMGVIATIGNLGANTVENSVFTMQLTVRRRRRPSTDALCLTVAHQILTRKHVLPLRNVQQRLDNSGAGNKDGNHYITVRLAQWRRICAWLTWAL